MLINEFDLELDIKPKKKLSFYWLQERNKTKDGLKYHLIILMKRHQKGIYRIMPNFEIVIK
jgi:hypothetical protein